MPLNELRQLRVLYQSFVFRLIDLDLVAVGGETQNLLVQIVAMLAAFSLVVAMLDLQRYSIAPPMSRQRLIGAAWGDEEFLISTSMVVAGLFAILAWNTILPDRHDSLVLIPLPVRLRTIALAKIASIFSALGIAVTAVNAFTGFSYPFLVVAPHSGALGPWRSLSAYWLTMIAGGLFVFCTALAVQGIAAQLLSYRLFLRISGLLQLLAFFAILSVYFLTPPIATLHGLIAPENQRLIAFLPSFWFLGLFQQLNGSALPLFEPLAARALLFTATVFAIATATYMLAWRRNIKRIVEQPDIAPADRSGLFSRAGRFIAAKLFSQPLDRAIVLFAARTFARSRQHRLLVAVYGGIGLAISLAYAKSFIYGDPSQRWDRPNVPFLIAGLVLLFFAITGVRAAFVFPVAPQANWIFRITAVSKPASYFAAVRKSLFGIAAFPVWIAAAILYFAIWPGRPALEHIALLTSFGILLIHKLFRRFRKIPFACSYLPGKSNLKIKVATFSIVLIVVADWGVRIELWAMERVARFAALLAILLACAIRARRNTAELAASPYNQIQFDDVPVPDVEPLDLRQDAVWSHEETYIDAIDPRANRTLAARIKPFAIGAAAALALGCIYEHTGEWRDHRRFPQVGRSVDIGGRSLNVYCSGEGSPAVVMDSGHALPGYEWALVQREIAKVTRACWYDRAGFGWSDPTPHINNVDSMVRDLRQLLRAAQISPPYVLVGHSLGGWNVRVYNGLYPGEVAGMVLVDAPHEDELKRIPDLPRRSIPEYLRHPVMIVTRIVGQFGIIRLLAPDPGPPPHGFSPEEWAMLSALQWQPKAVAAEANETGGIASVARVRAAGGLRDLPLIVLTAGKEHFDRKIMIELNGELARRSSRGEQILVENSGHMIPWEAPEAVIGAVQEIVTDVRGR